MKAIATLALMMAFAPTRIIAGTWTSHGPEGGLVTSLAVATNPLRIYAAGPGGVFASTDGGVHWNARNRGLAVLDVRAVAVDPGDPLTVYAATFGGGQGAGVFKSGDGGESWASINVGLTSLAAAALAIDPASPSTVYLGLVYGGVFKSTDSGAHWSPANGGLSSSFVQTLVVAPGNPSTLYVGTATGGVFRSADGGASWAPRNVGLPASSIFGLAVDPTDSTIVYAGPAGGGIFKSTNGGGSWTPLPAFNQTVFSLAFDASASSVLYAGTSDLGVIKTTDAGATWTLANAGMGFTGAFALAVDASTPGHLYAGTSGGTAGGVFESHDAAATWMPANAGLDNVRVSAVARDPSAADTLYAGTEGRGVFKSVDGGASWTAANAGLGSSDVRALTVNPAEPRTVYVGTSDAGAFRTSDGGATWQPTASLPGDFAYVNVLVLDPNQPSTIFANAYPAFGGGGRLFKSTDGGDGWQPLFAAPASVSLAIDPRDSATVYAGSNPNLYKSIDGGNTWAAVSGITDFGGISAIAIDPVHSSTIYVGTPNAMWKSVDAGATWASIGAGLGSARSVTSIVVDPSDPATVYVGTDRPVIEALGGVFRSADGGETWAQVVRGMPNLPVDAIALDPGPGRRIFAGTRFDGVFVYRPCGGPLDPSQCRSSLAPERTSLVLHDRSPDRGDTLRWKWTRGQATMPGDFGDATRATEYVLCVYDDVAASGRTVVQATGRVGAGCDGVGCWSPSKGGFSYRDPTASPGGLRRMTLTAGTDGEARIVVRGMGPNLRFPALPLTPPIRVQLEAGDACWQAEYSIDGIDRNDGVFFRSRGTAR